ncbi:hypothetical protein HUG17_4009 [Dermatophagoides farinae]|uniref:Uncharacterized protein n=1 Tax=Dermatophagoides farinae TaxID=6954 RepID=A0A9D4NXA1_DERFA|nr:hypothetical protein HUG17_4009 [Dermatophagoides farinae]
MSPKTKQQTQQGDDSDQMILIINTDHRYRFDPRHGIWNDLKATMMITKTIEDDQLKNSTNSIDNDSEKQIKNLLKSIETLQEENRLLKLKIEILIEMVTETTAELNLSGNNNKSTITATTTATAKTRK